AAMVAEMLGQAYGIGHDEDGRPYACVAGTSEAVGNLTVSHSKAFVAVGWSEQSLGIDIECASERPLSLAPRFLHESELPLLERLPHPAVTAALMLWTAKEAAFKRFSREGATTLSDIVLQMDNDGTMTARFGEAHASLTFVVEEEWTMCLCA
ncbi:MAG: 4'-phosphopantetheinyl transferase family protein, partial [Alloprevotella sp.]